MRCSVFVSVAGLGINHTLKPLGWQRGRLSALSAAGSQGRQTERVWITDPCIMWAGVAMCVLRSNLDDKISSLTSSHTVGLHKVSLAAHCSMICPQCWEQAATPFLSFPQTDKTGDMGCRQHVHGHYYHRGCIYTDDEHDCKNSIIMKIFIHWGILLPDLRLLFEELRVTPHTHSYDQDKYTHLVWAMIKMKKIP